MNDVSPPPDGGSYFPPPPYPSYPGYAPPPSGPPLPDAQPPGPQPPSRRSRLGLVGLAVAGGAFALLGAGFLLGRTTSSHSVQPVSASSDLASAGLNTAADPTAPAAPGCHDLKHGVAGTLKAVNGDTLTVTPNRGGNDVKVTTNGTTKITKVETGSLSDITNGSLVTVHGTSSNSGVSAEQVGILPAGTNLPTPPSAKEAFMEQHGFDVGKVTSVTSGGFVIQRADNSTINVTTSSSTKVVKTVTAKLSDLTVGQPVAAIGTTNPDGSVTATNVVQGPQGLNLKGVAPGFGPGYGRFGPFRHFGNGGPGGSSPSVNSTT